MHISNVGMSLLERKKYRIPWSYAFLYVKSVYGLKYVQKVLFLVYQKNQGSIAGCSTYNSDGSSLAKSVSLFLFFFFNIKSDNLTMARKKWEHFFLILKDLRRYLKKTLVPGELI